jgi:hypothetical protein
MRDADRAIADHLARMPEAHRRLLEPVIAANAADPWLREVLLVYLRHFVRVFDGNEPREPSEGVLVEELAALAGTARTGNDDADVEVAEAALRPRFAARGYEHLGGRTPPHLGPYVWRRTESRSFTVTLPRGEPQEVTVHLMHDFVLRGWLYWSTFGRQGAGGWFKDGEPGWADGLYCVRDRYGDPLEDDPAFRVSLLGHEAQHVADHRAHPNLTSGELEYRAKLVELIGYTSVEDRLRRFLDDARDDPEEPHPHAAHLIVTRLADRLSGQEPAEVDWASIEYERIARTSQDLLDEDDARLAAVLARP